MIADEHCLDCGEEYISMRDAVGSELKKTGGYRRDRTGEYYFDVTCPSCDRKQGLVVGSGRPEVYTIWPCSWNDEPCTENGCEYCHGEYV